MQNSVKKIFELKWLIHCIFLLAVFGFLGWVYLSYYHRYPYYFTWDMDQTTVLDAMSLQSGLLPEHINHPSFGIYFLFQFTHRIAHELGLVSLLNYDDVKNALGPILGMAELTDFFRAHSVVLSLVFVTVMWSSLHTLFALNGALSVFALLFLGTQVGIFYHTTMIRSEFYAILYWGFALWSASASLRMQTLKKSLLLLFLAGVFLGLSYLSKLQALFYLISFPFLLLCLNNFSLPDFWKSAGDKFGKKVAVANLVMLLFLLIGAHIRTSFGATFVEEYPINIVAVFFLILAIIMLLSHFIPQNRWKKPEIFWIQILFLGFLCSFLLHFFIPSISVKNAYKYMLIDAKMLFFRNNYQSAGVFGFWEAIGHVKDMLYFNPWMFLANLVVFTFYFFTRSKQGRVITLLFFGVLYFHMAYGVRSALRDILWAEALMNFVTLSFAIILWSERRRFSSILLAVICSTLLLGNFLGSQHIRIRTDLNHNLYGWLPYANFSHIYFGNHLVFHKHMELKYGNKFEEWKKKMATQQAMNYPTILRDATFAFPNQKITFKNVGLLEKDFPAFANDNDTFFQEIPQSLKGSTVVDNQFLPETGLRIIPGFVSKQFDNDAFDKFEYRKYPEAALTAVPRRDLKIFLFADTRDFASIRALFPKDSQITDSIFTFQKSTDQRTEYKGILVNWYIEIPINKINSRVFYVIQSKFSGSSFE